MADYRLTWNGPKVQNDVLDACNHALENIAEQAVSAIRQGAPYRTGFLRNSSFAIVTNSGESGKTIPTLVMGATAPYASYVELGTRFMPGRPFITTAAALIFPLIGPALRSALAGKGYH